MPEDCIERVVCDEGDRFLFQRISTHPPGHKIILGASGRLRSHRSSSNSHNLLSVVLVPGRRVRTGDQDQRLNKEDTLASEASSTGKLVRTDDDATKPSEK